MLTLVQVQFNLLGWLDSNQRPVPYERTALATELHPKMQFPNVFGIDLFARTGHHNLFTNPEKDKY